MLNRWQRMAVITFLAPPLAWRADQVYQSMPELPKGDSQGGTAGIVGHRASAG